MSLDKAITHGKEKRKPYRGSKSIDYTCRNHGSCQWCIRNRKHKMRDKHPTDKREAALEAIKNLYPGVPFTKRLMQKWHEENRNFMQCESAIERLPAADVAPVRHGRWVKTIGENGVTSACRCNLCGFEDNRYLLFNYCPNCGAKMDGEA